MKFKSHPWGVVSESWGQGGGGWGVTNIYHKSTIGVSHEKMSQFFLSNKKVTNFECFSDLSFIIGRMRRGGGQQSAKYTSPETNINPSIINDQSLKIEQIFLHQIKGL